jgi:hypothetical protein
VSDRGQGQIALDHVLIDGRDLEPVDAAAEDEGPDGVTSQRTPVGPVACQQSFTVIECHGNALKLRGSLRLGSLVDSRGYLEATGVKVPPDDDGEAAKVRRTFHHDEQHRAEHYEGLNEIRPYHCAQSALRMLRPL